MAAGAWLVPALVVATACTGMFNPRDGGSDGDVDSAADASGPCRDVACSGHGQCVVEGDGAWCDCFTGFRAVGLERPRASRSVPPATFATSLGLAMRGLDT